MSALCPSKKDDNNDSSSSSGSSSGSSSSSSGSGSSKSENKVKIEPTIPPTATSADVVTSRKCYGCGLTGHLSSACPSKQPPPSSSSSNNNSNDKNNDDNGAKKCRNCGVNGHVELDCPLNSKPAKCDKCSKSHKSFICPKQEPSSSSSSLAVDSFSSSITKAPLATVAVKTRKCYNCGQVGHMSSSCPSKTQDNEAKSNTTSLSASPSPLPLSSNNASNDDNDASPLPLTDESSNFKRKTGDIEEKKCQMCKETGHVARHCPNKDDKMACFNCGSKDHFAKECTEEKKADERTCHECGEIGHITRACPKRKRFRKKDSGKDICFICEQNDGHVAKNCPSLDELKTSFGVFLNNFNNNVPIELAECVRLLELCSRTMEINGALFVYDYLLKRKIALTEQIFDLLFHIYSRIGLSHSVLPALPKTGLPGEWPRDQLRRIVKSRKVGSLCAAAGENLPVVLQFLEANPRGSFENVFKLATFVAKGCGIGNKQARTAVLLLHSQGALAGAGVTFNKNKSKQPPGEDELLRAALQKEFPDKQEKWDEWLSVLQAQDLITLRDLRELDVKDLDSLPVSAALRSGLRRLQAKPVPVKPTTAKRKSGDVSSASHGGQPARKSKKKKQKKTPGLAESLV
jgi:cellular nucleic acid-binding protein